MKCFFSKDILTEHNFFKRFRDNYHILRFLFDYSTCIYCILCCPDVLMMDIQTFVPFSIVTTKITSAVMSLSSIPYSILHRSKILLADEENVDVDVRIIYV